MVKAGPKYYRDALAYYTRALEQKSCIAPNNSVYYCNRAAVQLMLRTSTPTARLPVMGSFVRQMTHASKRADCRCVWCIGNYNAVVLDCMSAIECSHTNIKAYIRYIPPCRVWWRSYTFYYTRLCVCACLLTTPTNPKPTPNQPQTNPKPTPNQPQTKPNQTNHLVPQQSSQGVQRP
jgi:hypothetical protein